MKNFRLLPVIGIFFIFSSAFVFAENDWHFFIEPEFSATYGQYDERLYDSVSKTLASHLEWEVKPLFGAGAAVAASNQKFYLSSGGFYFFNQKCGYSRDSDYTSSGMKYIYSEADNHNLAGVTSFFKADIKINSDARFSAEPSFVFNFDYRHFERKNAHGWYGASEYTSDGELHSWDSEYAHYFPDGKKHLEGISFKIFDFYFFTGVSFRLRITENIFLSMQGYVAPYGFICAHDEHYGRASDAAQKQVTDYWFNRYRLSAYFSFAVTKSVCIKISEISVYSPAKQGDLYLIDSSTGKWFKFPPQKIGSGSVLHTVYAGVEFKVF